VTTTLATSLGTGELKSHPPKLIVGTVVDARQYAGRITVNTVDKQRAVANDLTVPQNPSLCKQKAVLTLDNLQEVRCTRRSQSVHRLSNKLRHRTRTHQAQPDRSFYTWLGKPYSLNHLLQPFVRLLVGTGDLEPVIPCSCLVIGGNKLLDLTALRTSADRRSRR